MWFLSLLAKSFSVAARLIGRGGETWPGEIILKLYPRLGVVLRARFSLVILIAGTNGKTSTVKFISEALRQAGEVVITNRTGANLLNGLVSSALCQLPLFSKGKPPVAVFEVDEYALPEIARFFCPKIILFLNIFRDQLDRYGEVNNILERWKGSLQTLPETTLVYLSSDPALYYAFRELPNPKLPFMIPDSYLQKKPDLVFGDLVYCPICKTKLEYSGHYLAHLGNWQCTKCSIELPKAVFKFSEKNSQFQNLPSYQQINLLGAYTLLRTLNYSENVFSAALKNWQPAFGRGEIFASNKREYHFYLGKNPASWTAALREIARGNFSGGVLVIGLNNRVPDGHDVSWIYDANLESLSNKIKIVVYGDRAYDMATRLKIAGYRVLRVFETALQADQYLESSLFKQLYFLANYSALLEIRRLVVGKALI